jgi:hypothetical protein
MVTSVRMMFSLYVSVVALGVVAYVIVGLQP